MFLVLPIGDEPNEHVRKPLVTWLLIAANVAVFVWMLGQGASQPEQQERLLRQWGYVPSEARAVTILTHMFAHAGWLHLIGNMLFLWIFGDNVESRLGHLGFLVLYLVTGVAALHVHLLLTAGGQDMPLVGASGAVSGVQGLYFVACPGARVRLFFWMLYVVRVMLVPARGLMVVWFLIQDIVPLLLAGARDSVAHWAHLGGFAAGLLAMGLLVPFLGRNEPPPRRPLAERYPHRHRMRSW